MMSFTTPFTCSICKIEFCNPISLVKHVELDHPTALRLSTINITRTVHKTYSGLLIESIIVSEFKDSITMPTLPENHFNDKPIEIGDPVNYIEEHLENKSKDDNNLLSKKQIHEESLEIGDIENCIEEHSNKIIDISHALPILSENQIHKKSLKIRSIQNCIEENLDNMPKDYDTVPILSEKQFHEEFLEIRNIENCTEEEYSNKMTKISNALPKPADKQIYKKSLESGNNENHILRNSNNLFEKEISAPGF